MNKLISVVIICRNEAHIIGRTIAAAQLVSDDVVVVDSGSTDSTQSIVTASGAKLIETNWEGYGINKNKGVAAAKHDWILSIDADEIIDEALVKHLQTFTLSDTTVVYNIRFRAFFADSMIRFGEWANDQHVRLYNRTHVAWNEAAVHEGLVFPAGTKTVTITEGYIHHYTSRNIEEFAAKTVNYAMLNAQKYHSQGKKASWIQCRAAPVFSFIKNYLFRLGFLDGEAGFIVAKMNAWYTWLKYTRLRELNNK
ncbi:MAG: glycosyltransferase family 2 protein [Sediminibacterium sp.]|nr:glycosyltransferase family 2 protein [Sediminibacterium sp.]